MRKYIHPLLVRIYVKDSLGRFSIGHRGIISKSEKNSYNILLDLRSLSKNKS